MQESGSQKVVGSKLEEIDTASPADLLLLNLTGSHGHHYTFRDQLLLKLAPLLRPSNSN